MEDKLVEIIGFLEKDLKDIDSAVKHLSKSQEAAQALVDSNLEFAETFREHMILLQQEIKNLLETLKTDTDDIIQKWYRLASELNIMAEKLSRMTTYFESVNFPARLDKIDTSIATVQQGILSNQTILNDLYRKMDQHAEKIITYNVQISKQISQTKTFAIMAFCAIIAGIGISIASILIR